jgi:hypothetical protein
MGPKTDTFNKPLLIVCFQRTIRGDRLEQQKMKKLILKPIIQKLCLQCKQELNFFKLLRGELYCNDLCHQQRSREAVARAKQGYMEIPSVP